MNPTIIGSHFIHKDRITSTNDEAESLLQTGPVQDGTVIVTEYQESGRGHAGTTWESAYGKNLLLSVIFKPDFLEPRDQFYISKVLALGAKDFIDLYLDEVSIKWPNDIYVGNDKIAGILIENVITGNQFTYAIGGLGINANQKTFSEDLPNPTSIALKLGADIELSQGLKLLCTMINNHYHSLLKGQYGDLDKRYDASLYRRGHWTAFQMGGTSFEGKIAGVEPTGELLIEMKSGQKKKFRFKEVEYL